MRRRRTDDALWSQGARLCAAVRSGTALGLDDSALLDQIARDLAPDVYASYMPPQRPCDALAAAAGPDWDREIDLWTNRLRWSPPSAAATGMALMGSGPTAKRPRMDTGPTDVLVGPDETTGPAAPIVPAYRPVRVPARPPLAVLRLMLPGVPEALLPYVALPDNMDVAPRAVDPDATIMTRRPPLFGVGRATRPTALSDGMDIAPSADPLVGSDAAHYEEIVPFDVQDLIMRRLIEADPQSALALAGTSTRQASLLTHKIERARQQTAAQSLADFGQPTGAIGDYTRARTAFGGDPRDAPLAIALCLMEAFVRFLFEHDRAAGAARRATQRDPRDVDARTSMAQGGQAPHTGDHAFAYDSRLVDQVASDPRLGNLRDRVRAWYQWIETPERERQRHASSNRGILQTLIKEHVGPKGYAPPLARPLERMSNSFVEMNTQGDRCPSGWAQALGHFGAPHKRRMQQVSDLVQADLPRMGRPAWEWARNSIGDYPDEFINRGVREHLRGPCALVAREAPLAMPDFTSVFNMQFFLRPGVVTDKLYAKMASPAIERLLA
ncbi:hypothetical protein psal_cds_601 [Pandoravirus salinus]|uniref:Uncharacterized protein n=1 Tax=Pandoravirus salinus TaxID=1349410 RepID=S4W2Q5_9VIRU|nr:hypothetical protein psal_cds_601 [Pandoravirus salinus]AGO84470.1 hypothetical protein psal_cds_601 [Pandoravirus salinus]